MTTTVSDFAPGDTVTWVADGVTLSGEVLPSTAPSVHKSMVRVRRTDSGQIVRVAPADLTVTYLIPMAPATPDQADYGVTHKSYVVYRTVKSYSPTRVVVWSNVNRPNPHPGETRRTDYGSIGGEGQYLDPHNNGTDDPTTILLSTESTVISADPRTGTGGSLSGQMFATYETRIAEGDRIALVFPGEPAETTIVGTVTFTGPGCGNGHGRVIVD